MRAPDTSGTALRSARWVALGVPAFLLGGALVSQYVFGLFPCEMCWWQRYPHIAAIALGLLAFARKPARWSVALAALAVLVSGLIGAFHAGVEYGWWEGITGCSSAVDLSGGNPLDAIMNAEIVRCDVAPWSLLGVSLAGWNFLFSTAGALIVFALLAKSRRSR
jgi:disulfide bond formation protein DsbB